MVPQHQIVFMHVCERVSLCLCVCVCTGQISGASQVVARKATEKFLGNFYEQRTNFRVSFSCFALDIAPETAGIDFKFYNTHTNARMQGVCVCCNLHKLGQENSAKFNEQAMSPAAAL